MVKGDDFTSVDRKPASSLFQRSCSAYHFRKLRHASMRGVRLSWQKRTRLGLPGSAIVIRNDDCLRSLEHGFRHGQSDSDGRATAIHATLMNGSLALLVARFVRPRGARRLPE